MTMLQAIKSTKVIWLHHCSISLRINKKQAREIKAQFREWLSDDDLFADQTPSWRIKGGKLHLHVPS